MKILTTLFILTLAQFTFGQITNSAHDFSGAAWNTSTEICIVCHTPHNADITVLNAPLWNHAVTAETFQLYTSSTFDGVSGQPDGSSKLCLSCHDGVTAVDNYGGATGGTDLIIGDPNLSTDLRDDHPVSFVYDAALAAADGGLQDPTTEVSGLGATIDADMLFLNKLQCASCHDVHNGANQDYLLVKSNTGSDLCITCHAK